MRTFENNAGIKPEDIIKSHRFSAPAVKKFDYKTVPHVIQFVTRGNRTSPILGGANEDYCNMFNVVLLKRKFRHTLTEQEELDIVREARNIPSGEIIDILFSGHPRDFFATVFEAWRACYMRRKKNELKKIQMVLDLLAEYDPRRGDTSEEWSCKPYSNA